MKQAYSSCASLKSFDKQAKAKEKFFTWRHNVTSYPKIHDLNMQTIVMQYLKYNLIKHCLAREGVILDTWLDVLYLMHKHWY